VAYAIRAEGRWAEAEGLWNKLTPHASAGFLVGLPLSLFLFLLLLRAPPCRKRRSLRRRVWGVRRRVRVVFSGHGPSWAFTPNFSRSAATALVFLHGALRPTPQVDTRYRHCGEQRIPGKGQLHRRNGPFLALRPLAVAPGTRGVPVSAQRCSTQVGRRETRHQRSKCLHPQGPLAVLAALSSRL
jgi:hypothetical protein